MPIVETRITVSIPDGGVTVGELERRVAEVLQEAGRRLVAAACEAMEGQAVAAQRRERRVQQVKARRLEMVTRFGWLRLMRQ